MSKKKIVFLSGGTGTPKLLTGREIISKNYNITVIGNTADDWKFYGLYVSPDIDTILFTLSNIIDQSKWWGITGDTFEMINFLKNTLKENIWFSLGDKDTGLSLYRTHLLNNGISLTEATILLKNRLEIVEEVLPMANQPISTIIQTTEGPQHLQEFWVKNKGKPQVLNVFFKGDLSKTTEEVLRALESAIHIIIGPSNPVSSIGPILSIKPIRKTIINHREKVTAISPIIGDAPISGPTAMFLKAWKKKQSVLALAELYGDLIANVMIHPTDKELGKELKKQDIEPIVEDIIIKNAKDASRILNRIVK